MNIILNNHQNDEASLIALSTHVPGCAHLFDLLNAGSKEWCNDLDMQILLFLRKDDADGFSNMLLCGEEDYVGDESNLGFYLAGRKREKIRILFERLLHPHELSSNNEETMISYLLTNMGSEEALGETWKLLMEEFGDSREHFTLLLDKGCINKNNISYLTAGMADRNTSMKSLLLAKKTEMLGDNDFFSDLDL